MDCIDHIIIALVLNILALFGIDYFNLHGFGIEACLSNIVAIIVVYLKYKEGKK